MLFLDRVTERIFYIYVDTIWSKVMRYIFLDLAFTMSQRDQISSHLKVYVRSFPLPRPSGINKLRARWQTCTQRARNEVFACTKLRARRSIKNQSKHLYVVLNVLRLASCFCVWKQIIFGTIRFDNDNLFQPISCC